MASSTFVGVWEALKEDTTHQALSPGLQEQCRYLGQELEKERSHHHSLGARGVGVLLTV